MISVTSIPRFVSCGVGGVLLLGSLIVLASLDQDDARHSFGHRGGLHQYLYHCDIIVIYHFISKQNQSKIDSNYGSTRKAHVSNAFLWVMVTRSFCNHEFMRFILFFWIEVLCCSEGRMFFNLIFSFNSLHQTVVT